MKVEFFPCLIEEVWGLDLAIHDERATVQDLIEAIQPWCDDNQIYKAYLAEKQGPCRGCPINCCRECFVLPDAISFGWLHESLGVTPTEFIKRYFDQELLSKGLPRLRSSPCIFLKEGLCTVYPHRTLICRLYICTPMTDEAQTMVYGVVAAGIGEFIRLAEEQGLLNIQGANVAWSGYEKMMLELIRFEADRADNPFRGARDYQSIPLRSFCSEADWQVLTQKKITSK
ncbi:MAG: YkgJ family cysteine cluster protein [Syntrophomonadaceae bacterium]|nr:YkgJ family cysteine cluster protein [Syntrophomonadaceae bacterium]